MMPLYGTRCVDDGVQFLAGMMLRTVLRPIAQGRRLVDAQSRARPAGAADLPAVPRSGSSPSQPGR